MSVLNQKGQALLIVVLAMVVALTVGLSLFPEVLLIYVIPSRKSVHSRLVRRRGGS